MSDEEQKLYDEVLKAAEKLLENAKFIKDDPWTKGLVILDEVLVERLTRAVVFLLIHEVTSSGMQVTHLPAQEPCEK